eukprot:scaffold189005_cov30-Tisochrysis_lutea.AAC.3
MDGMHLLVEVVQCREGLPRTGWEAAHGRLSVGRRLMVGSAKVHCVSDGHHIGQRLYLGEDRCERLLWERAVRPDVVAK